MSKQIKEMMMEEITAKLGDHRDLLVVDSSAMDAIENNKFRLELFKQGITLLAVKNTLARKALEGLGITGLDEILKGPSVLVWGGEDAVALSKEITKWAKELEPLNIKGGSVEGTPLDQDGVEKLSKSPGRAELIGRIATLILSPGAQLAGAMLGPGGTVSGQVKAKAEGGDEAATAEE